MGMTYTQHDQQLCAAFQLELPQGKRVKFQFPPKVASDSRRGEWREIPTYASTPAAVYRASGARTISVSWAYIVDGSAWKVSDVHAQCQLLRAYFELSEDELANSNFLVGQVQMWSMGGPTPFTCRLMSSDIKHGETIVGQGNNAFPLRTDVSIELKLWAQGAVGEANQPIPALNDVTPPEWY